MMNELVHSPIVRYKPKFFSKKLQLLFGNFKTPDENVDYINPSEFKKILLRSTIIPFCFVILISAIFMFQSKNLFDENAKVRKADMFLASAERSLKLIIDSETALRGYLLTGDEKYLAPWNNAIVEYPRTHSELVNLEKGSSLQLTRLNRIAVLYEVWLNSARYVIEKKRKHYQVLSEQIVLRKDLMDEIRLRYTQLNNIEQQSRDVNWNEAESSARDSLLYTTLLGVGVGGLIAYINYNHILRLNRNYQSILSSLKDATVNLEHTVAERTKELTSLNHELEAFSYSVSHDLRAPLRGIDGFSQFLMDEYKDKLDGDALKYLNYIRSGVQKMGTLIDDLINLSRLTRMEMKIEEVDIATMSEEVMNEVAKGSTKKYQFKNLNHELIHADPGLLRILLTNLITNAWKYSQVRDEVIIEMGKSTKDQKDIYYIKDNGLGFDMKYYSKLFQPFQRLHAQEKIEGTGIGLATVARVVKRHGGDIWAEGKVDAGATFYFRLS